MIQNPQPKPTAKAQKPKITQYQLKPKVSKETAKIKLYVCTIFPGIKDPETKKITITPQMEFNRQLLRNVKGLDVTFIWTKAGYFSHRHLKHVPDPIQIKHRNVYLDKVPVNEWLLVLDADEALFGALANIPNILNIMNQNPDIDYALISELLPNGNFLLRPRLIRKREGLSYGGPKQKHDYISDSQGNNYIDIAAKERSWILDFLGFFHYKNGWALEIYPEHRVIEMPENMIKLKDQFPDGINATTDTIDQFNKEQARMNQLNESDEYR